MKIEIISGKDFTADFTVISSDGLTGEVLDPSDTATISIHTSGSNATCIISPISMVIKDAANGLFTVTIPAIETSKLISQIGFAEDNYPTQGNYKAILSFLLISGNRDAVVPVFVIGVGECLVV